MKIVFVLLVCLAWAPAAFAASLSELETAIIRQDYAAAKALASELIKDTSLTPQELNEARFYLSLSHLTLGDYLQARKLLEELIKQPLDVEMRDRAYLGLFNSYYLNEEYRDALRIIDQLYELSPQSPFLSMIYLKMARVNLKLTNWQKAQEYLKKIINEFPSSLEIHTAKQLLEERQYFAVQVGAFLDRQKAEKQVEELRQKSEYAYIVETLDKDSRKFYRVRVGQMTLLDDARELQARLSKLGYPTEIYP